MVKKLFLMALSLASISMALAANPGEVGYHQELSRESVEILNVVSQNAADFAKLVEDYYFVSAVSVDVLAPKDEFHSNITRYTFIARKRGSIMMAPPADKARKLVLDESYDRRIQDDIPTEWDNHGGVQEVDVPPTGASNPQPCICPPSLDKSPTEPKPFICICPAPVYPTR